MTANRLRLLSATFLLMCAGVAFNLVALQPPSEQLAMTAVPPHAEPGPADPSPSEPVVEVINAESEVTLQAVERELNHLGYLADGVQPNERNFTRAAILAFEYDHGLPLTATASPELLEALILGRARAPGASTKIETEIAASLIRRVQATLVRLGYPVGSIDGQIGPRTRAAIKAFEQHEGLMPTGRVSAQLFAILVREATPSDG